MAARAKVPEIASRCQPKAACSGFKNRLKVYGTIGAKLTITP